MRLYDGVSLAFGPTINNGFYYDFELKHKLSEDDFPAIEQEMAKIVEKAEPLRAILTWTRRSCQTLQRHAPDPQSRTHSNWTSRTRPIGVLSPR